MQIGIFLSFYLVNFIYYSSFLFFFPFSSHCLLCLYSLVQNEKDNKNSSKTKSQIQTNDSANHFLFKWTRAIININSTNLSITQTELYFIRVKLEPKGFWAWCGSYSPLCEGPPTTKILGLPLGSTIFR